MKKQRAKKGTGTRLLAYIFKHYPAHIITVVICIILSALTVSSSAVPMMS